jgi:hypothetical protein
MKIKNGALTIAIIALAGFLFLAVDAMTATEAPDEITIDNSGYKKKRQGPVKFSHGKHSKDKAYGAKCTDCHHDYKDGKNVWKEGDPVKKCAECHDPNGKSKDKPEGLRYAYHDNCEDCHEKAQKEGNKVAPKKTKCRDCHEK